MEDNLYNNKNSIDNYDNIFNLSKQTLLNMIEKYKDNNYILSRINKHINNYLPKIIENEYNNYEKRLNRNTYLSNEQKIFVQIFLSKNKYFYLTNNNCFYEYNDKNYFIIKEDSIIHKLLSSISKEKKLLPWKYKTKFLIIKLIKERSLLQTIPETYTIQNILNTIYPSIFKTKNEAKYFLTIIGDNILKKNSNLIFLVNQKTKKLLNELDAISSLSIGYHNITSNFLAKYHENHNYDNCRLIKINETFSPDIWKDTLNNIGLDLLCVAIHYSNRYINSDNFLETKADDELKSYIYYLKYNTSINIVSNFIDNALLKTDNTHNNKIEWKSLHFIWKQYLNNLYLPNIIYSNTLKIYFKELMKNDYDIFNDCLLNYASPYLPLHKDFDKFWNETIILNNYDNNMYSQDYLLNFDELEIDELCMLFKTWHKQSQEQLLSNGNLNEDNILKILKHFYPDIKIIDDKYILNIRCNLWDKLDEIDNSLILLKCEYSINKLTKNKEIEFISFDEAYNYYYKRCNIHSQKFIVSKKYFEKYINYKCNSFIIYDKFIRIDYSIIDNDK